MSWPFKTKPDKNLQLFLSEFPTWAAVHSARLVDELESEDNNGWANVLGDNISKTALINCLIGAHLLYLTVTPEGGIASSLFGKDIFEKSLSVLPDKAKQFYLLALSFYLKDREQEDTNMASSLGKFYNVKIDPLDACIAFVTDKEVNNSEEFTLLIGTLLPTINQLQREQLEWLGELVGRWSGVQ